MPLNEPRLDRCALAQIERPTLHVWPAIRNGGLTLLPVR